MRDSVLLPAVPLGRSVAPDNFCPETAKVVRVQNGVSCPPPHLKLHRAFYYQPFRHQHFYDPRHHRRDFWRRRPARAAATATASLLVDLAGLGNPGGAFSTLLKLKFTNPSQLPKHTNTLTRFQWLDVSPQHVQRTHSAPPRSVLETEKTLSRVATFPMFAFDFYSSTSSASHWDCNAPAPQFWWLGVPSLVKCRGG